MRNYIWILFRSPIEFIWKTCKNNILVLWLHLYSSMIFHTKLWLSRIIATIWNYLLFLSSAWVQFSFDRWAHYISYNVWFYIWSWSVFPAFKQSYSKDFSFGSIEFSNFLSIVGIDLPELAFIPFSFIY